MIEKIIDNHMIHRIKIIYCIFMAVFCQLAAQPVLSSEIYRIVDESGRVTYTDIAAEDTENV